MQDRIMGIWEGMLAKKAIAIAPIDSTKPVVKGSPVQRVYVMFRALVASYKISIGLAMGMGMPGASPAPPPIPGDPAVDPGGANMGADPKPMPPSPTPTGPMPTGGKH
jgi:hypothetical protein